MKNWTTQVKKFLTARPFLQSNHASNEERDKIFQSRETEIERKGSLAEVENQMFQMYFVQPFKKLTCCLVLFSVLPMV